MTQLVFLQLVLIWPLVPVSGLRFPIFTMAFAKSVKNVVDLVLYVVTWESVEPPLKSCWSEWRRPLLFTKLVKYELSKVVGLLVSSGERLLSPPELGQLACKDDWNEASMLVSLYNRSRKLVHLACPIVWDPERATISLALKPLFEKEEMIPLRFKVGAGMSLLAVLKLAVVESLLPNWTVQLGPPKATTESRATTARMSAQETTPGQELSTWDLMVSTTSNPLTEFAFGTAVFSPVKLDVSSSRIDASHPLTKQSWKWRRSRDAPMRASLFTAVFTADLMIERAFGHDDE